MSDGLPHPRTTSALFGQERAERMLLAAYRSGRMPHAVLLTGLRGIGKATLGYRLARFVLAWPDADAPAVQSAQSLAVDPDHPAARQVAAGSHPDLVTLEAEPGSAVPVDAVRRAVRVFATTAGEGGWRVAVIDAAEDLNTAAANALLKALEEPPRRALFVLVSHTPGRLLATIRSRTVAFSLRPLAPEALGQAAAALGRAFPESEAERRRVAALGQGSLARSLDIADAGLALHGRLKRLLDRLPELDRLTAHEIADEMTADDARFALGIELLRAWMWGSLRLTALSKPLEVCAHEDRKQGCAEAAQPCLGEGDPDTFSRLPGRLARWAEVWDKVEDSLRLAAAFNLDRRHVVVSAFRALAAAADASRTESA